MPNSNACANIFRVDLINGNNADTKERNQMPQIQYGGSKGSGDVVVLDFVVRHIGF